MDLKQLRLGQTPRLTKAVVFLLLALQVAIGLFCAYLFVHSPNTEHSALIQAAAYSLGAGVPLFALALLVVTARSGIRAVEARKTALFLDIVPRALSHVDLAPQDPSLGMVAYRGKRLRAARVRPERPPVQLEVGLTRDASTASYRLEAAHHGMPVVLWLSIDLKIDQATVCLRAPEAAIPPGTKLADHCPSTLHGATVSGGYKIDPVERADRIAGRSYRTLILRRSFVGDEFLWDPANTFFFVEDLGLMVASFMRECSALLAPPTSDPEPDRAVEPAVTA
ncbi:hypothetical protein [Rehaibacterium terrae]|jgi:hypothetical protein|uniref:Uncharacterized protein n=1 Tax=Rehaibacterium terrae TaxID=1341696 RepID=A0A7W7V7N9_9GAMM|nr:hypothetical protein [Rehaibacterium terrae]MBB5014672.1 hypothetical protein [Rehaibacterium terrae]